MNKISLHIPPQMWQKFSQSMLTARSQNEEVIGFLFCQRQQINKNQVRYIPKSWVVPLPNCYEHQDIDGLILKQEFHQFLLENQLEKQELDVVHIHTHAGQEIPDFSYIDDRYESEYAQFLSKNFKHKPYLISGVFNSNLQQGKFRIWNRKGNSFEQVKFSNSWLEIKNTNNNLLGENELMLSRQKIFGETAQQQLNQLKVALIGCGGIGSIFAELLGRLGVKNWVLIDPDRLEETNLNRMVAATYLMVEKQEHKVNYVKGLIKRIYQTGSNVKGISSKIEAESIKKEIIDCDLLVVATDNHYSRQIAQELALEYTLPFICLGTHIDFKPFLRMYCRITIPPLGGNWCLMCGNIINLHKAALEIAPQEIYHLAADRGYLEGINNPGVFWLNSICASTAVGIIQGIISGFLNVEKGIDWIYQFPDSKWLKTDVRSLINSNCYFCASSDEKLQDDSLLMDKSYIL